MNFSTFQEHPDSYRKPERFAQKQKKRKTSIQEALRFKDFVKKDTIPLQQLFHRFAINRAWCRMTWQLVSCSSWERC